MVFEQQPKIEKPEEETKEIKKEGKQRWAEFIVVEMRKEKPLREVIEECARVVGTGKSREDTEKWIQDMQERVEELLKREDPEKGIRRAKNILEERLRILKSQLEKEEIPSGQKIAMIKQRTVETRILAEEILKILEKMEKELPFCGYKGNIEYW